MRESCAPVGIGTQNSEPQPWHRQYLKSAESHRMVIADGEEPPSPQSGHGPESTAVMPFATARGSRCAPER